MPVQAMSTGLSRGELPKIALSIIVMSSKVIIVSAVALTKRSEGSPGTAVAADEAGKATMALQWDPSCC